MKILIAFVLALGVFSHCSAEIKLTEGENEVRAIAFGESEVVVRAQVSPLSLDHCEGWRWGAENECPRLALVKLAVYVGKEKVFLPRSAFADLGLPARIDLKTGPSLLDVVISGGDAATAYTAILKFSRTELKRRKVFGNEFKQTAWEDTSYSFPK